MCNITDWCKVREGQNNSKIRVNSEKRAKIAHILLKLCPLIVFFVQFIACLNYEHFGTEIHS